LQPPLWNPLAINYTLPSVRLRSGPLSQELWDQDVTAAGPTGPDRLWHGLLARGTSLEAFTEAGIDTARWHEMR